MELIFQLRRKTTSNLAVDNFTTEKGHRQRLERKKKEKKKRRSGGESKIKMKWKRKKKMKMKRRSISKYSDTISKALRRANYTMAAPRKQVKKIQKNK